MYNNNIPHNYGNMQQNIRPNRPQANNNNNRFLGGFAVPFVLGGITGSLLTPRYNYPVYYGFNRPMYNPYPYYPYYPNYPYRPY